MGSKLPFAAICMKVGLGAFLILGRQGDAKVKAVGVSQVLPTLPIATNEALFAACGTAPLPTAAPLR
jgi:hypothetical protein